MCGPLTVAGGVNMETCPVSQRESMQCFPYSDHEHRGQAGKETVLHV